MLCCQVAIPSQAVSVSVTSSNTVPPSPLGVLIVADGVSTVRVHPQHSHLPVFWTLNSSVSGDRVGFSQCPVYELFFNIKLALVYGC